MSLRLNASSEAPICLTEEAIERLRPSAPETFGRALQEGFRKEVRSFEPSVHGGDRRRLVARLRRCKLDRGLEAYDLEPTRAKELTVAYVQELWSLAVGRGWAVDQKGLRMRSAAAELARAFLQQDAAVEQQGWKAMAHWISERALEREPGALLKALDRASKSRLE